MDYDDGDTEEMDINDIGKGIDLHKKLMTASHELLRPSRNKKLVTASRELLRSSRRK